MKAGQAFYGNHYEKRYWDLINKYEHNVNAFTDDDYAKLNALQTIMKRSVKQSCKDVVWVESCRKYDKLRNRKENTSVRQTRKRRYVKA